MRPFCQITLTTCLQCGIYFSSRRQANNVKHGTYYPSRPQKYRMSELTGQSGRGGQDHCITVDRIDTTLVSCRPQNNWTHVSGLTRGNANPTNKHQQTEPLTDNKNNLKLKNVTIVHQWRTDARRRMVLYDSRTKVQQIRGISVEWSDPSRCQISSRSGRKCAQISASKNFWPP